MEDIFQWCREGNAMQVRVWLDDTEHDMNQGYSMNSPYLECNPVPHHEAPAVFRVRLHHRLTCLAAPLWSISSPQLTLPNNF